MRHVRRFPDLFLASFRQPWSRLGLIMALSLGALLVAIGAMGVLGLTINRDIETRATDALADDTKLEEFGERGEEVRIAVLELRQVHQTLMIDPGENTGLLASFEVSHRRLLEQIQRLDDVDHLEPDAPSADDLRATAARYYDIFQPAIHTYAQNSTTMMAADSTSMGLLRGLEKDTEQIDQFDELRAKIALDDVKERSSQERLILFSVLGGLGMAGVGLGWMAYRVIGQMRSLYQSQQSSAVQLIDALSARTVFIADASHELRTPLTVLKGNAELGLHLQRDCSHEEILQEIVHESDRMTRLVENLLFLARSDADAVPLKLETFSSESLTRGIATRAEMLVHEQNGTFSTDLTGNAALAVDQGQIEQAVMILVDNAAKYGPPGGHVELRTCTGQDELLVEVVDKGPGIPPADVPHIFERFTRVDKARSRSLGGAGLGLAIAKTIVEAHHGTLEVDSQVNHGTTMRIRLPLDGSPAAVRPAPEAAGASRQESAPAPPAHHPLPGATAVANGSPIASRATGTPSLHSPISATSPSPNGDGHEDVRSVH